MTDPTDFDTLTPITALMQDRALAEHRKSVAETRRLQAELDEIDARRAAMMADPGSIGARQVLGADAAWQGWLVRRRSEILRDMALARAREAETGAQAQQALARHDALQDLARAEARRRAAARAAATLAQLDQLGLMRRG